MRRTHNDSVTIICRTVICMLMAFSTCVLCGCRSKQTPELIDYEEIQSAQEGAEADEDSGTAETSQTSDKITVFVCGAVRNEGVYVLPEGARVCDAVEAAGGFTEEADTSYVNQAAILRDAQKLLIPTAEDAQALRQQGILKDAPVYDDSSDNKGQGDSLIDLNSATQEELMRIPGIGEVKAAEIIAYRNEHGPFADTAEIMNVSGIGQASYDRIRPYITVR